jgi:chromosome segregation ATPase
MKFIEGIVRKYKREYKRKLKSGKLRSYCTEQYTITLSNKDHNLQDKQEIIVIPLDIYKKYVEDNENEFKKLKFNLTSELDSCRSIIEDFESTLEDKNNIIADLRRNISFLENNIDQNSKQIEELFAYKDKANETRSKYDKLRNRFDHLQARFNKCQGDLNVLEREVSVLRVVLAKVEKLSLWERVLNRLPVEVKQLSSGLEKE